MNLCNERFLGGELSKLVYACGIENGTIYEARLDFEAFNLVSILFEYLCSGYGIIFTRSDSSHTFKRCSQSRITDIIASSLCESVFNDSVFNAALSQFGTHSRVVLNGDTGIIDDNTCDRLFQSFGKVGNNLLLLLKNLYTWHNYTTFRNNKAKLENKKSFRNEAYGKTINRFINLSSAG